MDCLCNMSGIFRDSFQNVVELLDDLFQRAAEADEPEHRNFIRHVTFRGFSYCDLNSADPQLLSVMLRSRALSARSSYT